MMKAKLIEYVKNNRWIYIIYHYVASAFVNVLRLFVKTDDKLILFVSYGGRHFNDSPKCLYDVMKYDDRYKGYRLVWAFRNTSQFDEVERLNDYLLLTKRLGWGILLYTIKGEILPDSYYNSLQLNSFED